MITRVNTMVYAMRCIKNVWSREWKRILERPTIYLMTIVLPPFLFLYFVWIYSAGNVRGIPLLVYDGDRSELSRMLIRSLEASGTFHIVAIAPSEADIDEAFRSGKIHAAVVIPRDLERTVKLGKTGTLVVYLNGINVLLENTALKEVTSIVKTYSTGITVKKLRAKGMSQEHATRNAYPLQIDVHPLYNAYYNYAQYIGVGLLPAMFQILIMMVAVLLLSSEFTHHTFNDLVRVAEESVWAIILGKSLPYLLLYAITILGLLKIIFPLFHIPLFGSFWALFMLFLLFCAASHFMGLVLSSLFHNQQLATEIVLFVNIPAFVFSGYVFPLWAMPPIHRYFAMALPYTHFLYAYLQIQAMGLPLSAAFQGYWILALFFVGSCILLYGILKYRIIEEKTKPQMGEE